MDDARQIKVVETRRDLRRFCVQLDKIIANRDERLCAVSFDTETYSPNERKGRKVLKAEGLILDRARAMYLSFAHGNKGWGIPLSTFKEGYLTPEYVFKKLGPYFAHPRLKIIMHNANYDINVILNHGVKLNFGKVYCTLIAGHSWNENLPNSLKERCILVGMRLKPTKTVNMTDMEEITRYAVYDAFTTWELYKAYTFGRTVFVAPEGKNRNMLLKGARLKFFKREMRALKHVVRMERRGMKIDTKLTRVLYKKITKRLEETAARLYTKNGEPFNLNSPKQKSDFLFKKLKLPKQHVTAAGAFSTDKFALAKLRAHSKYAKMLGDHTGLVKLRQFVDPHRGFVYYADEAGRIHATFSQVGARTARASCSNPNLQQIPSKTDTMGIRKCFIAPKGHVLIVADMDQLELRLMAIHSRDRMLLNAYKTGTSIHIQTGVKCGLLPKNVTKDMIKGDKKLERAYMISKNCNFGLMYEGQVFTLMRQLLIEGVDIDEHETKHIIDRYWQVYSGVPEYRYNLYEECRDNGFIENICGRPFRIMNINSPFNRLRRAAERQCINTKIQSGGADWLKYAMIRCSEDEFLLEHRCMLLLAVHDELIFSVPEKYADVCEKRVVRNMQTPPPKITAKLIIPLTASAGIGKNWAEAKG